MKLLVPLVALVGACVFAYYAYARRQAVSGQRRAWVPPWVYIAESDDFAEHLVEEFSYRSH